MALQRQLRGHPIDAQRQLLEVAGHPHRPGAVAEVALDLAEDRRHGEAREGHVAVGVEAIDRLEQTERGDLFEIVEGLLLRW